jgi:hypothetical protein
MTIEQARGWLIRTSLAISFVILLFVVVAPGVLGFPLDADRGQDTRILQIILPVFVGYLASASHFVFSERGQAAAADTRPLSGNALTLVKWPVLAWGILSVAMMGAFWYSNRSSGPPGSGWTVDKLAAYLTIGLSLLTATTNIAVNYLFAKEKKPE